MFYTDLRYESCHLLFVLALLRFSLGVDCNENGVGRPAACGWDQNVLVHLYTTVGGSTLRNIMRIGREPDRGELLPEL